MCLECYQYLDQLFKDYPKEQLRNHVYLLIHTGRKIQKRWVEAAVVPDDIPLSYIKAFLLGRPNTQVHFEGITPILGLRGFVIEPQRNVLRIMVWIETTVRGLEQQFNGT
jgi:hypothetical protein